MPEASSVLWGLGAIGGVNCDGSLYTLRRLGTLEFQLVPFRSPLLRERVSSVPLLRLLSAIGLLEECRISSRTVINVDRAELYAVAHIEGRGCMII